ncbi:MAG TPA: TetR/AcrR family transcriptional regulator [Mycobacterium sp.]|nr:TetR/AcrR family transcriptional regulator [Mycobacterium sp.]
MSATPSEFPPQIAGATEHAVEKLLDVAADEYTTAGVKQTSIAEIARQAGVPVEAVHRRWSNVEELLTAVVVRDLHSHIADVHRSVDCLSDTDDQIAEVFASVLWFLDGHPLVGGAIRSDADVILPRAAVSVAPIIGAAVAFVVDAIRTIVLGAGGRSIDTEVLTELLTRLVQSILLTRGRATVLTTRSDVTRYASQCVVPLVNTLGTSS